MLLPNCPLSLFSLLVHSSSGPLIIHTISTLRIWSPADGRCLAVLYGHAGPVLAVAALAPSGDVLSGSGDKTIKVWRGGSCIATLTGHTDTVR